MLVVSIKVTAGYCCNVLDQWAHWERGQSSIHKPPPPLLHTWDPNPQNNSKNGPQNGPWNFWKPLTADYVAAGALFVRKMVPGIMEALNG